VTRDYVLASRQFPTRNPLRSEWPCFVQERPNAVFALTGNISRMRDIHPSAVSINPDVTLNSSWYRISRSRSTPKRHLLNALRHSRGLHNSYLPNLSHRSLASCANAGSTSTAPTLRLPFFTSSASFLLTTTLTYPAIPACKPYRSVEIMLNATTTSQST
jgi:hypothetical protein